MFGGVAVRRGRRSAKYDEEGAEIASILKTLLDGDKY